MLIPRATDEHLHQKSLHTYQNVGKTSFKIKLSMKRIYHHCTCMSPGATKNIYISNLRLISTLTWKLEPGVYHDTMSVHNWWCTHVPTIQVQWMYGYSHYPQHQLNQTCQITLIRATIEWPCGMFRQPKFTHPIPWSHWVASPCCRGCAEEGKLIIWGLIVGAEGGWGGGRRERNMITIIIAGNVWWI